MLRSSDITAKGKWEWRKNSEENFGFVAVLSGEEECSPKCKVVATGELGRKEGGAADIDCKVVHRRSSSEENKRSRVVKPWNSNFYDSI